MARVLDDTELKNLMNETTPQQDEPDVQDVPVTIFTSTSGGPFVVTDIGAWAYMATGLFAIGRWGGVNEERHVLIPYDKIEWLDFNYAALEAAAEGEASDG